MLKCLLEEGQPNKSAARSASAQSSGGWREALALLGVVQAAQYTRAPSSTRKVMRISVLLVETVLT